MSSNRSSINNRYILSVVEAEEDHLSTKPIIQQEHHHTSNNLSVIKRHMPLSPSEDELNILIEKPSPRAGSPKYFRKQIKSPLEKARSSFNHIHLDIDEDLVLSSDDEDQVIHPRYSNEIMDKTSMRIAYAAEGDDGERSSNSSPDAPLRSSLRSPKMSSVYDDMFDENQDSPNNDGDIYSSSPAFSTIEDELNFYKQKYEETSRDLQVMSENYLKYQQSSEDLEKEYDAEIERYEQQSQQYESRITELIEEIDFIKVGCHFYSS